MTITYPCPQCRTPLDGRTAAWLRCPKCGRASKPPLATPPPAVLEPVTPAATPVRDDPPQTRPTGPANGEPILVPLGTVSAPTITRPLRHVDPREPALSPVRVAATWVLFGCVSASLLLYLHESYELISLFGGVSLLILASLTLPLATQA